MTLAKEAGADCAKFQHFRAEHIVSDHGFKALGGQPAWRRRLRSGQRSAPCLRTGATGSRRIRRGRSWGVECLRTISRHGRHVVRRVGACASTRFCRLHRVPNELSGLGRLHHQLRLDQFLSRPALDISPAGNSQCCHSHPTDAPAKPPTALIRARRACPVYCWPSGRTPQRGSSRALASPCFAPAPKAGIGPANKCSPVLRGRGLAGLQPMTALICSGRR